MENSNQPMRKRIVEGGEGTYEIFVTGESKRYLREEEMTTIEIDEVLARIKRRQDNTETR